MIEDWGKILLGKLASKITKGSTPTTYGFKYLQQGINFIKIENVKNGIIDVNGIYQFISKEAHEHQKRSQLESGDVLFSIAGTIGETCIIKKEHLPANTNQAFAIISGFNAALNERFLRLQLDSFVSRKVKSKARGGAMNNVSLGNLKELEVKLPPLPIQRAIVSKIESLFSSLDSGIADLKKAQEQLKMYRQAVLKKAFEGDWNITSVGELFDFVGGGTPSKRIKEYWNGNIPWASVKDVKGDYLFHTQDFITQKGLSNSSANLAKKGELILITRISPGKSIIANIDSAINQDLKIVKPKNKFNIRYCFFLFKSIERDCVKLSSGTTVLGINLKNLKSIEIPVIDLKDQDIIVKQIESRLSVCDKVEKDIKDSLDKSQALRQSILKKAFEGKLLTASEIDRCKQESDYEPASVLLERIKKEKKN
jgi:type I restriction enzyme S subunit